MNAADVEEHAKKYLVTIHQKLGKAYSHQAYVHVMGFMGYLKVMEQRKGIE